MRVALLSILLVAALVTVSAGQCRYEKWDEYLGTTLLRVPQGSAYIFGTTRVAVDADGAPNAYHPDDVGLHCTKGTTFKGLDCPANAGYPDSHWWPSVLVPDPTNPNRAYVQPASSEFAGFFVSQTSLRDTSKPLTDPKKYVDSRNIPYIVFPGQFHKMKGTGTTGDLGYAFNLANGKQSPFVVAEIGPPSAKLGEMSIALAAALGGTNPNPRTGAGTPSGQFAYVIFPKSGSTHKWPLTFEQIATHATELLDASGGAEGIVACRAAL